jgi:ABC-2 type transport system ATP-binding protein
MPANTTSSGRKSRIADVMGVLGLSEGSTGLVSKKSGGMRKRISIGTELISDPELLILDEPLSGLDPVNTDLFKSIIREEIAKGKYLIMSSHQMATVEEFCNDITILSRSKTVLQGHLPTIKKSYGRVNLSLKTEGDITPYLAESGVTLVSAKEFEYSLKVSNEMQANALLARLIAGGVPVITFDLREPSLHEIFVEKVGEPHEEA